MMIAEAQDAVIAKLQEIPGAAVDAWVGDWEAILTQPQKFPSLWVSYRGAAFAEKRVVGSDRADHKMSFAIILLHKNLKSRKACAAECAATIEAVREKLTGYKILNYGWLWPENEELLGAENGMLVYGLSYRLNTNT